jgi:hypothetical protein
VTITLKLTPEVEAGLLAQAQASGKSPEEYLLSVVEEALLPAQEASSTATASRQDAIRRMLEFGEKHHLSLGEPVTRHLLHEGHRL